MIKVLYLKILHIGFYIFDNRIFIAIYLNAPTWLITVLIIVLLVLWILVFLTININLYIDYWRNAPPNADRVVQNLSPMVINESVFN